VPLEAQASARQRGQMSKTTAITDRPTVASARDVAVQYLRELIYSGALKADDRVEVQNIAVALGTSRTPVRDAAWQLATEGLIEVQARVGFFVRHISAAEILDIYDIRLALEPLMAASAALRSTESERSAFQKSLSQLQAAQRRARVRDYVLIIEQRRQALLDMSRSRALIETLKGLDGRIRLLRIRNLSLPGVLSASLEQHTAIANAVALGDPRGAFATMRDHMVHARNRMREALTSVSEGPNAGCDVCSPLDFVTGDGFMPTAEPSDGSRAAMLLSAQ
jgi:DNA-binding GntR family transcriptional regulator